MQTVPELRKNDLAMLAKIGALNWLGENIHRRDPLWQGEYAGRPTGPLLSELPERDEESPLARMTIDERLAADFHGTGVTVGPHPMAYHRNVLSRMGIVCSSDLQNLKDGHKTAHRRMRDCSAEARNSKRVRVLEPRR